MYVPKHFSESDLAVLQTLMRDYSFATLVSTQEDGVPIATPLPISHRRGRTGIFFSRAKEHHKAPSFEMNWK